MSKKSKYIIFEMRGGLEVPMVFSPLIQHREITVVGGKPISAGFCSLDEHEPYYDSVYGESISLKLKSRKEDADILNKYLEYDC